MTVRRNARLFLCFMTSPLEFIANSVDGYNIDWLGRIRFKLLSDVPDVGIDGPFRAFVIDAAHGLFQELHAAKDPIRCRGQDIKQAEFGRRKGNPRLFPAYFKAFLINEQVPDLVRSSLIQNLPAAAPEEAFTRAISSRT